MAVFTGWILVLIGLAPGSYTLLTLPTNREGEIYGGGGGGQKKKSQ
mgnify:CR=1 FL=1